MIGLDDTEQEIAGKTFRTAMSPDEDRGVEDDSHVPTLGTLVHAQRREAEPEDVRPGLLPVERPPTADAGTKAASAAVTRTLS